MAECIFHPQVEAAENCQGCYRPLCRDCVLEFLGGRYCIQCRNYWLAYAQGPSGTGVAGAPSAPVPQPGFADQIIPARNPQALTGYYISVGSLVPCVGLALGPAAITLGFLGLRARRQDPSLPGQAHSVVAIILGLVTTLANWGGLLWVLMGGLR